MERNNMSLVAAIVVIGAVAYAVYVYKTKHAAEGAEVMTTTVMPSEPMAETRASSEAPAAPATAHAAPTMVNNKAELDALSGSNKPVVLKVFATWCPPCQAMKPEFEAVAAQLGDKFIFAEADADQFADKDALKVEGLPTILVFKNGAEVARFIGGRDAAGIKEELAKIA